MSSMRVEITVSSLTYRGDRDERLIEAAVHGEADDAEKALTLALERLALLDYGRSSVFREETLRIALHEAVRYIAQPELAAAAARYGETEDEYRERLLRLCRVALGTAV
jgi:hypothetical protein